MPSYSAWERKVQVTSFSRVLTCPKRMPMYSPKSSPARNQELIASAFFPISLFEPRLFGLFMQGSHDAALLELECSRYIDGVIMNFVGAVGDVWHTGQVSDTARDFAP